MLSFIRNSVLTVLLWLMRLSRKHVLYYNKEHFFSSMYLKNLYCYHKWLSKINVFSSSKNLLHLDDQTVIAYYCLTSASRNNYIIFFRKNIFHLVKQFGSISSVPCLIYKKIINLILKGKSSLRRTML